MQRSAVRPSPVFFGILAVAVVGGLLAAFGDQATIFSRSQDPLIVAGVVLLVIGGWVASLSLHEFGHAMVAYRGGDYSVAHKGYLNLDVRKYTDPVFSIVLPLVFLLIGGIPLPGGAVYINDSALRSRSVSSWVSLAGPLSNLGVGIVVTLAVSLIPMPDGLVAGLSYLALLQIVTFILNILPIPGLDGWGVWEPYLPYNAQQFGAKVRPWAPLALFAALFAFPTVAEVFFSLGRTVFELIGGDMRAASFGQFNFMFWR